MYFKKNLETKTVKVCYLTNPKIESTKTILEKPLSFLDTFHTTSFYHTHFLKQVPYIKSDQNKKVLPQPEDVIMQEIQKANDFQKQAYELLKENARNTLNPYRCKFNPVALASHYFYKHCPKSITYADPFLEHEEKWLIKAMSGGLTYAEPSKLSTGFEYDINSMYPYLMTQCQYLNGQPVFHFISDLKNIKEDTYCIIRCKITSHNKKLFRRNKNNYYCGLDVKNALEEGYKIELIHDLRPNYMYYPKNTMIPGKEVFGRFVKDMYKMKLNGAPFSKVVLNCLWGKLFEKDVYEVESKYNKQINVDHINQIKKYFLILMKKSKRIISFESTDL